MNEQVNEWRVALIGVYDDIIEIEKTGDEHLIATIYDRDYTYLFSASRGLLEACRLLNEAVSVNVHNLPEIDDADKLRKARLIAGAAYHSATRSDQ